MEERRAVLHLIMLYHEAEAAMIRVLLHGAQRGGQILRRTHNPREAGATPAAATKTGRR